MRRPRVSPASRAGFDPASLPGSVFAPATPPSRVIALEQDVRPPPGPFRLRAADRDGVMRRRDGVLTRLIHHGDEPAVVQAWPTGSAVRVRAEAPSREGAAFGIERMRFALNLDHDLSPFRRDFKRAPLLAPIIRRMPWIRPWRAAEPFQA